MKQRYRYDEQDDEVQEVVPSEGEADEAEPEREPKLYTGLYL